MEVKSWFDHFRTIGENRRRGGIKAAEMRRRKKNKNTTVPTETSRESDYQCGVCHTPYQEFTDTQEQWIDCEACDSWFHFTCLGITAIPDVFLCHICET